MSQRFGEVTQKEPNWANKSRHSQSSSRTTTSRSRNNEASPGDSTAKISKALSWLLRHGAPKENVKVYPGGFINVDDALQYLNLKNRIIVTEEELKDLVSSNDKQRFTLRTDEITKQLQIRANQGHSFEVENLDLSPITDPSKYPTVIHGTYLKCWNSIKAQGLSRMTRCHIHFAPGEHGDKNVISGMRSSVEIYIYIDLRKALEGGMKFFVSQNNVILCPGNERGFLETKYFIKAVNLISGKELPLT